MVIFNVFILKQGPKFPLNSLVLLALQVVAGKQTDVSLDIPWICIIALLDLKCRQFECFIGFPK
jgi:hypothetical protein